LENEVVFDERLKEYADREGIFKSSDLKYYFLVAVFLGIGYIVIKKYDKKWMELI